MHLLAFLDSLGVFFLLAIIGIVDYTFNCYPPPHPISICYACNDCSTSVWTEQNGNITIF